MPDLYHVTSRHVAYSITREGLHPDYSRCSRPGVYLASRDRLPWLARHVSRRHGLAPDQIVVYRCRVSRRALRRVARGLYRSVAVVLPERITLEPGSVAACCN